MKYRRWIAKVAVALMVFGAGALAAIVPASHGAAAPAESAAACSVTTGINGPTKNGTIVTVHFRIKVEGCAGQYWTEYSNIAGPGASDNGRTVTYRGDRNYVATMSVPCRTGTYNVYLQVIGESFDSFRETSKYIRC
ncbi:hypothetical protein K3N28_00255 [Glycomyces sp. TRM65418]|uniref:hypothetical protein n=1 Tax=Glycomyces sp. TRM65418 TaxID=2867006 RepID=UPI001CE4E19E|nr:hypothetical protein [Glycomyces sp. TRM65418]MCC3761512.1 hypothetical protein [Glycomyces sp. TRM65418]QZD55610.1 hypothetical protein K3N28_00255 [Glycomyces sp. TRM65418]